MSGWDAVPDSSPVLKSGWDAVPESTDSGKQPKPKRGKLHQFARDVSPLVRMLDPTEPTSAITELGNYAHPFYPAAMVRGVVNPLMGLAGADQYDLSKSVEPTLASVAKGASDVVAAPLQIGAYASGNEALRNFVNQGVTGIDQGYRERFRPDRLGEIMGSAAVIPNIPGLGVGGKGLVAAAKAIGGNALIGAAAAPLSSVEQGNLSPVDFWNKKIEEMKLGAALGGGVSAVTEALPLAGQAARRVLGTPAQREAALLRAQEIRSVTASKEFPQGVEPSLAEALNSPNLKHLENAMEYVPGSGRGAQLEAQNKGLQASVKAQRANTPSTLFSPEGAGADIRASAKAKFSLNQKEFGEPFNFVRDSVDAVPGAASPDNALGAVREAIKAEGLLSTKDKAAISRLKDLEKNLMSGDYGNSYAKLATEEDRLASEVSGLLNSDSATDRAVGRHYRAIAKGFRADKEAAAMKVDPSGFLRDVEAEANTAYAENVHSLNPNRATDWKGYRAEARKLHGREGFTEDIGPKILQGDRPGMATYAKKGLTPDGHEAVKSEIWRLVDEAANTTAEGGKSKTQVFSPLKAKSELDNHANFIKEFMTPEERHGIDGLKNALGTMARAGQYMETLATGKFKAAMGGITAIAPAATAAFQGVYAPLAAELATMGASKVYTKLSGSKAGKEWLLKSASSPEGSRMSQNLMPDLAKILGIGSARNENPSEEAEK